MPQKIKHAAARLAGAGSDFLFGLKKWIELNKTKNDLQSEIQTLLTQQINLQDEIVKLNIDQDYKLVLFYKSNFFHNLMHEYIFH